MQLKDVHSIYFIGIGGIGMSALARYFHRRGVAVAGYDRTETELTRALAAEGMNIRYQEDVASLPPADLVVYTPAVPAAHAELLHFQAQNFPVYKRSEVLGLISRGMHTVGIGGTHGKTTTTTLTAHLMRHAGIDASAFLGGISRNFGSNFVAGLGDWVVVEADEYDRSFLRLDPDIAVIMAMDADHLEIYGDHANMIETGFRAFARKIKPGGKLLVRHDLAHYFPASTDYPAVETFGVGAGQHQSDNIRVENGYFVFDYTSPLGRIEGLQHPHPGQHNVENATAAITVALSLGATAEDIRSGLLAFRGIGRRFEFIIREPQQVYIDDYAHHPAELEAAIGAARQLYPGRKITGIFQPHLYSRTRDFAEGFARALDGLDELLLLDIYPAREEPIPGVSAATIFEQMHLTHKTQLSKAELMQSLASREIDVLLTMGAGDIDTFVQPIKQLLENRK